MKHKHHGHQSVAHSLMGHGHHKNECNPAQILMGSHHASGGIVPIRGMASDAIPGEAKANPMKRGGRAHESQMNLEDHNRAAGRMHGRTELEKEDRSRGSAFKKGGNPHKHRRFAMGGAAKERKGYPFT